MKGLFTTVMAGASLLWAAPGAAQTAGSNPDQIVNQALYETVLMTELDNRCDVLTREGRLALSEVRGRVNALALKSNALYRKVQETAKDMQADAKGKLKPGCESYRSDAMWRNLATKWNNIGLLQLATLSDTTIQKWCRLDTESYSFLRREAARAMASVKTFPEANWKAGFDNRLAYHRAHCQKRRSFFVPSSNVMEIAGELPTTYMIHQRNGVTEGKLSRYSDVFARRGLADGTRAEIVNERDDYPNRIRMTRDNGLVVTFDGGERPKGDSIASLFIGVEPGTFGMNMKSGEGESWTLPADDLAALLDKAKSVYQPRITMTIETWEEALDGGDPIFVGSFYPDSLRQAIDYSEYETP